ncbi:MAG TPA: GNAT family N-acetyltransferase [Candidatus Chromulinivoraceae bacterium]|nr:GNAT family N-acetyltransferase [Candidatus Chromulinivoraceae bacterium]
MKPIIRRAVKEDIDGIYRLSCKVHQISYTDLIPEQERKIFLQYFAMSKSARQRRFDFFLPKLDDPAWYIWVAVANGLIVGYTKEVRADDRTIRKRGLFVDPDYQGRGIGKALFKESLSVAKPGDTLYLSVVENNFRAQTLYRKYGFKKTGYTKNDFYGAKMITMELTVG